ncbi:dTDP-4-dehydrorhamnose reductase [Methylocaldum marinum]|uniref:dTDP-4-dehydrorhamnose reductase n=1 Tax=Methylocaldum marinum TaxID=1432792 RepID=A0A250KRC4_9GAMM|nr:dTDP-4-dehydrorhamnose reductase [Methylocaldum marinum]BBA34102.1 dTDP-4-dehydrorhamnose reductase [Methylocaldum marinum]
MKILLIGREGQVAWELRRSLACLGQVVALDRRSTPPLDLADPDSIRTSIRQIRPHLIVNAAAYTAVDKAEQESELAFRINAEAPGILAEEALAVGAGLIHYSTDYVFPGDGETPYREDDPIGPQNTYGRSKLTGEEAIRQVGAPHFVLRTAWVYGRRGQNFLLTMLRLMRERELVRVVDDQYGAPTWSRLIAEATALLVAKSSVKERFEPGERQGTYHLSCGGQTSWYGFACRILDYSREKGLLPASTTRLEPIPSSDYPTPAQRPKYSVLSNEKLFDQFGLVLPDWDQALRLCLDDFGC